MSTAMATQTPQRASGSPIGRRTGPFVGLLLIIVTLCTVGMVMVMSASAVVGLHQFGSSWYFVLRQALWLALGMVVLVVTMRIDYRWLRRVAPWGLGISMALLVLVLIPGVGSSTYGSTRWVGAGMLRIQPSEFAKLGVILFVADLLSRRAHRMGELRITLQPVFLVTGVMCVLLLLQPNLGTTVVVVATVLTMLFVAGAPLLPVAGSIAAGAAAAAVLALAAPYRRERMLAFWQPWKDPQDSGYQVIQSIVGIAQGGMFGVGLGASRSKWGFLPFAHTDFIFAIIAEEAGLVGACFILLLFVALTWLGVVVTLRAPDAFGMLLAIGITTWFCVQAIVNIGVVIGLVPVTGVPLPFVSFGGSSMLAAMAAAGILLNVARQGR